MSDGLKMLLEQHDRAAAVYADILDQFDPSAITLSRRLREPALAAQKLQAPWEELILRECTDPTFFARAGIFFRAIDPTNLTLVQQMVLHQLRQWYLTPFAERQRAQLWGITSDADRVLIDQRVNDTVTWLAKTSFAAYSQPTALPPWSITL